MFFPPLMNLKKRQISIHDIEILDWWLGTRKSNVRKYLNPLQFSIDCQIDFNHSLKLFTLSTLDESIDLLSIRYVSRCLNCNYLLSTQEEYFNLNEVHLICPNCGEKHSEKLIKNEVEVYFTLKQSPSDSFQPNFTPPIGVPLGNAESLQGSMIKDTFNDDDDLSRLFSCLK